MCFGGIRESFLEEMKNEWVIKLRKRWLGKWGEDDGGIVFFEKKNILFNGYMVKKRKDWLKNWKMFCVVKG